MVRKSLGHWYCVNRKEEAGRQKAENMCLPRMMVQQCCPGNATARIMGWLVLLHLKAPSQLSCRRLGASMLPGTRSDALTHTNGYTDFQHTWASLCPPLHSQHLFRQHLNPWLSAWLSMCDVAKCWSRALSLPAAPLTLLSPPAPYLPSLSIRADQGICSWAWTATLLPLSLTTSLPPCLSLTLAPRLPHLMTNYRKRE